MNTNYLIIFLTILIFVLLILLILLFFMPFFDFNFNFDFNNKFFYGNSKNNLSLKEGLLSKPNKNITHLLILILK